LHESSNVIARPEAQLRDEPMPAPGWFTAAIAQSPERSVVHVEGADIEVLSWGRQDDPAVLLVHGYTAHADWWSFIAPLLLTGRRVVALSFSGMGRSGWRDAYSIQLHAREILAVADAQGVFAAPYPPVIVAHSYGSFATRLLAQQQGHRFGGAVLVDGALSAREDDDDEFDGVPARGHTHRIYPTLEGALARFRFVPEQSCAHPWITDYIARTSIGPVRSAHGETGWSWRFDPDLRAKTGSFTSEEVVAPFNCPTALMFGDRSPLMTPQRIAFVREVTPHDVPWIVIPDAGHHIMVDQPLALVAALRSLLAVWQPAATVAADAAPG
jgi:pimeloyl-ACP methyl ester carboxylesterase